MFWSPRAGASTSRVNNQDAKKKPILRPGSMTCLPVGPSVKPNQLVTAPSDALATIFAYFANTPLV